MAVLNAITLVLTGESVHRDQSFIYLADHSYCPYRIGRFWGTLRLSVFPRGPNTGLRVQSDRLGLASTSIVSVKK